MAPAGRPRAARNRDLPPGVYRRVRGGKARYYDADGKALGSDKARAAQEIARRMADPIGKTPGTWRHASADYIAWLEDPRSDCTLAPKTRANYRKVLRKLDEVFGAALLAEIKPVNIGTILRAKSATDAPETAQARLGHTSRRMTEKHYLRDVPLADPGVLPGGIFDQNSG